MNTRELIEMAQLDAYGLLDESERDAFEAAFASAPASLRAHIRDEQSRLVRDPALFADVDPPPSLKDEVLADVGSARLRDTVLSRIHSEINGGVPSAVEPELFFDPLSDQMDYEDDDVRAPIPFGASRQVSRIWRTIGVTAAAAGVTLAVTAVYLNQKVGEISIAHGQSAVENEISRYGGPIDDVLFNNGTRRIVMSAADPEFAGEASIFLTGDSAESAQVYWSKLPQTEGVTYRIVAIDESQNTTDLGEIPKTGLRSRMVALDPAKTERIAIYAVPTGAPLSEGRLVLVADIRNA